MSSWTSLTIQKETDKSLEEEIRPELEEHDQIRNETSDLIKLKLRGPGRHQDAVNLIKKLQENLKQGKQFVIDISDTTDSGEGTIYKNWKKEEDIYPQEVIKGEQPEIGNDVAYEIQNQTGIRPLTT